MNEKLEQLKKKFQSLLPQGSVHANVIQPSRDWFGLLGAITLFGVSLGIFGAYVSYSVATDQSDNDSGDAQVELPLDSERLLSGVEAIESRAEYFGVIREQTGSGSAPRTREVVIQPVEGEDSGKGEVVEESE